MKDMFHALEWHIIKEDIAKQCSFSLGKQYILAETVHYDALWVQRELQRGKEALALYAAYKAPSFAGIHDVSMMLSQIQKGFVAEEREIYQIAQLTRASMHMKTYRKESEIKAEHVYDLIDALSVHKHIVEKVETCISANYDMMDSASSTLRGIRKSISSTEMEIAKATQDFMARYSASLMDTITATRNGRMCVLVKNSDKNKIKGFVHGESASGQAVYIEPESLLRLNNRLQSLEAQEKEEVYRIRKELCALIKPEVSSYLGDLDTFALLDALFAKAKWAYERNGVYAELSEEEELYFKEARHPLIEEEKVVANTYRLQSPYRHLLITGSNTGGKTVTLKTIGLFTVLTLSGFPILCEEAKVPCFDGVYVDIGDAQSIVESLSTFSAHLSTLSRICKQATSHSLVLLDELGSGTDPHEGECLAIAIIEFFRERNIMSVATTHYAKLKEYAKKGDDILLSSVAFDMEKMQPTYRYLEGYSGQSNALEIAQRYHLHEDIIKRAYVLKEEGKSDTQKLLERLDKERIELLQSKQELAKQQELLLSQKEVLEKEQKEWALKRHKMIEEAESKALGIMEEAKEKADAIIEELHSLHKEAKVKEHEIIQIKSRFNENEEVEENEQDKKQYTFKEKDYVKLTKLGYHGEILSLKGNRAVVLANGMKMNVKTSELEPTTRPKIKSVSAHTSKRSTHATVSRECNVIGMRAVEALAVVDKYLDNALYAKIYEVRLVHGHGTGALRKAIHEYLKRNKRVDSYRYGGEGEGGLGATVVTLKHGGKNG